MVDELKDATTKKPLHQRDFYLQGAKILDRETASTSLNPNWLSEDQKLGPAKE